MSTRTYEVRVQGLVPTEDLLDALSHVDIAEHEFRTVLTGHFVDQSALYGFLNLLRSYGLEVVEVRRAPRSSGGVSSNGPGSDAPGDGGQGR